MIERKEKPDAAGKWWVERAVGNYSAYEFVEDDTWGLVGKETITPVKEFVCAGDQWYRCYVPGLDTEIPDLSPEVRSAVCSALRRAGVWDDGRGLHKDIDALAAQRDEARQEVERLTKDVEHLVNKYNAVNDERLNVMEQLAETGAELASLRSQQGKGEGDGENFVEFINRLGDHLRASKKHCEQIGNVVKAFSSLHDTLEEASRAT